jgi:hypothetical protein
MWDNGTFKYLIKWKGYDVSDNIWEPISNVDDAPDLLEQFHQEHPDALKPTNTPPKSTPYSEMTKIIRLSGVRHTGGDNVRKPSLKKVHRTFWQHPERLRTF